MTQKWLFVQVKNCESPRGSGVLAGSQDRKPNSHRKKECHVKMVRKKLSDIAQPLTSQSIQKYDRQTCSHMPSGTIVFAVTETDGSLNFIEVSIKERFVGICADNPSLQR